MKITTFLFVAIGVVGSPFVQRLRAQDSKITTNLGGGVTVPLSQTGAIAGASANAVLGIGYNLDQRQSVIGQFMWAGLPVDKQALRPIRAIAGANDVSGSSNLFALTANYRFKLQGNTFGVYWIGGGGLYYRRATLSREVDVGTITVCSPIWYWYGYSCSEGKISDDQTLISNGSTALGGNAGMGTTIRIADDGYKFYVESRYHYAPTKNVKTKLLTITLGFVW